VFKLNPLLGQGCVKSTRRPQGRTETNSSPIFQFDAYARRLPARPRSLGKYFGASLIGFLLMHGSVLTPMREGPSWFADACLRFAETGPDVAACKVSFSCSRVAASCLWPRLKPNFHIRCIYLGTCMQSELHCFGLRPRLTRPESR
jgi:hypothetical protein